MKIARGVIQKAKKVVVYGPEGIGKSTFASKFPNPVFIDTEGSTSSMDVARLPRPTSWQMLLEEIDYVKSNPHVCNTLVIDTIDWAVTDCENLKTLSIGPSVKEIGNMAFFNCEGLT
ncbi:MAG: AAA family ATPase, partial [Dorea sp.]|nr:AAA family ATPase [Dorea sp.]